MVWTAFGFLAFYALEQADDAARRPRDGRRARSRRRQPPAHRRRSARPGWASTASSTASRWRPASRSVAGLGVVIAVVVIIHRFSDGIGVVSFLLASRAPAHGLSLAHPGRRRARSSASCSGPSWPSRTRSSGAMLGVLRRLLPVRRRRRAAARGPSSRPVALVVAGDARRRGRDLRVLGGRRRDRHRGALTSARRDRRLISARARPPARPASASRSRAPGRVTASDAATTARRAASSSD